MACIKIERRLNMARIRIEDDAYLQETYEFIKTLLNHEKIVSLYRSQSSKSIYLCLSDQDYYHIVLRLSDHKGGYDRSFQEIDSTSNELAIRSKIHQALYREDAWIPITPKRYAIFKLIDAFRKNNIKCFIPTNRRQKYAYIVDYNESPKPKTRFKLNEEISNELRKLTRLGFISTTGAKHKRKDKRNEIYLPPLAHDIIAYKENERAYKKYWQKNFEEHLDLNNIKNPTNPWLFAEEK